MGRNIQGIADKVLEVLESYSWPGNIRELANAIEHAFVHCRGLVLREADLPHHVVNVSPTVPQKKTRKTQKQLDLVERELIVKELEAANWKKHVAAKRLGMSRATLWRKMEKFGIDK
jgi:transcriptional regulator with PAS, ATPase and Fis domain